MKHNLWGHALFLASNMDPKTHASIQTRFVWTNPILERNYNFPVSHTEKLQLNPKVCSKYECGLSRKACYHDSNIASYC